MPFLIGNRYQTRDGRNAILIGASDDGLLFAIAYGGQERAEYTAMRNHDGRLGNHDAPGDIVPIKPSDKELKLIMDIARTEGMEDMTLLIRRVLNGDY
jgi:hypothetical protein